MFWSEQALWFILAASEAFYMCVKLEFAYCATLVSSRGFFFTHTSMKCKLYRNSPKSHHTFCTLTSIIVCILTLITIMPWLHNRLFHRWVSEWHIWITRKKRQRQAVYPLPTCLMSPFIELCCISSWPCSQSYSDIGYRFGCLDKNKVCCHASNVFVDWTDGCTKYEFAHLEAGLAS